MRRFRGCMSTVVVSFEKLPLVSQDVTDAGENTFWKLKLVFLEKRL